MCELPQTHAAGILDLIDPAALSPLAESSVLINLKEKQQIAFVVILTEIVWGTDTFSRSTL